IGMAIPLPRVHTIELHLAFHLLPKRRPVRLVCRLVPVVVRRAVALRQRALTSRQIVEVFLALGHQPAWESGAAAFRTLAPLARLIPLLLAGRHAADNNHAGFAVEEYLFDEIVEAVGLRIALQVETHVFEKLILSKPTAGAGSPFHAQVVCVGEVGLNVEDEVLALWPSLRGRG